MTTSRLVLAAVIGWMAFPSIHQAADWPIWRGPNRDDISPDKGLLREWPAEGPKSLWVYDQAGFGYSGFTLVDGLLYTLGTRDADTWVIAIDTATGKEKWAAKFAADDQSGYNTGWGHGPRSSPTISDGKVYALGPKGDLACLDASSGALVWQTSLTKEYQGKTPGWGYSESPLVDGDAVIVTPGSPTSGAILALNKNTGAKIWHATGLTDSDKDNAHYSSVQVIEWNGKRQYLQLLQNTVVSLDPANGNVLWKAPWKDGKVAVIPTPIFEKGYLYVTSGYNAGSGLFQVGTDNSVKPLWDSNKMKNHHGGVVKFGGHVYGFSDGPGLVCQDFLTGEIVWNQKGRTLTKGAVHLADGMLFCLNEDGGIVTLAEASPTAFKKLGEFTLAPQSEKRHPQGRIWVHPLVLDGKLYLRDQEYIVCYQVK